MRKKLTIEEFNRRYTIRAVRESYHNIELTDHVSGPNEIHETFHDTDDIDHFLVYEGHAKPILVVNSHSKGDLLKDLEEFLNLDISSFNEAYDKNRIVTNKVKSAPQSNKDWWNKI